MDRPNRLRLIACGLGLLLSTTGCRSLMQRRAIPPEPPVARESAPAQFGSDSSAMLRASEGSAAPGGPVSGGAYSPGGLYGPSGGAGGSPRPDLPAPGAPSTVPTPSADPFADTPGGLGGSPAPAASGAGSTGPDLGSGLR